MVAFKCKDGLIDGFLSRAKKAESTGEHETAESIDEVFGGAATGAALGAGLGAALPFLLARFGGRVPMPLLNRQFMTRSGALTGSALGSFGGRWLPQALQIGQEGYRTGAGIFPQTKKAGMANLNAVVDGFLSGLERFATKQSDEIFKGIGTGAAIGSGLSAATALPILFGRLGRRLPRKLLNKMILGRALAGAAAGGAAGGITAKEQPHVFHYNYHGTKGGGK